MSLFHHRDWQSSIVLGSYLYIDGGEIATWNGSGSGLLSTHSYFNTTGGINTVQEPSTYSIDLTQSWTNRSVTLFPIDKTAPVLIREALWPDASGEVFYAYSGGYSDETAPSDPSAYANQLWQFSPSSNSGVWSNVSPSGDATFSALNRTEFGTYFSGDGVGFALGGLRNDKTTYNLTDTMLVPGLVMYNTSSHEWFNMSSSGYPPTGTTVEGAGQFVPAYGSNGLLFFFGGANALDETSAQIPAQADHGTRPAKLNNVAMYDPITQHWATQTVTGDLPHPCSEPCVVGAAGDNGTYEIFLYGGATSDAATSVDQGGVYVLTLPAFRWLKQTATPTSGRTRHSCNIIGNRQMVVVGGLPITLESGLDFTPPDPWHKGIGIFDLSAMEWASGYDANAAAYVTPNIVKEYYLNNPRYPSSWSSAEVEGWFTSDVTNANPHSSATPSPKPSGTNIGAIVGGTIGGVVLLVAVGLLIWFLRRKRIKARTGDMHAAAGNTAWDKAQPAGPYSDGSPRSEIDGVARHELSVKERPGEAGSQQIYELPHDSLM